MKKIIITCLFIIPILFNNTLLSMLIIRKRLCTTTITTKKKQQELITKLIEENSKLKNENWELNQIIISQTPSITDHLRLKGPHPYEVHKYMDALKNDPDKVTKILQSILTPE